MESNRGSAPCRRGPAKGRRRGPDNALLALTTLGRRSISKVKLSRNCARRKVDVQGAGAADWCPASGGSGNLDGMLSAELAKNQGYNLQRDGDPNDTCTTSSRWQPDVHEVKGSAPPSSMAAPAPASPSARSRAPLSLFVGLASTN